MATTPTGAARSRVRLHRDWRAILRRAWSIRLLIIAGLLSGAEVALPLLDESVLPQGALAALSAVVTGAALVARLLAQRGIADDQA